MSTTRLRLTDRLPLTCTRSGTCCHGKDVWLSPWELASLAAARGMSAAAFREAHTDCGGIRLRFDGPAGWQGLSACSQYDPACGCSVHAGRPLACRLYPLGRERQADATRYLHRGKAFPCLAGCPTVVELAHLTVADYLAGQDVATHEAAADAYLELMQQLADGAFVLLLESGLAASGDRTTLRRWRELGDMDPSARAAALPAAWGDRLMVPALALPLEPPAAYAAAHHDLLQAAAQAEFAGLAEAAALSHASSLMLALALQLGRGLGADPAELARRWVATAKGHGARD